MCSMHLHCVRPSTHTLCLSCIHDIAGRHSVNRACTCTSEPIARNVSPLKVKNRCPDKHCMYTVCTPRVPTPNFIACPSATTHGATLRPKAAENTSRARRARLLHHSNCPCISMIFVAIMCGLGYAQTHAFSFCLCQTEDVVRRYCDCLVFLGLVCGSNIVFLIGKSAYHGYKRWCNFL